MKPRGLSTGGDNQGRAQGENLRQRVRSVCTVAYAVLHTVIGIEVTRYVNVWCVGQGVCFLKYSSMFIALLTLYTLYRSGR